MVRHVLCTSYHNLHLNYVPKHSPLREKDLETLKDFIWTTGKILVLTGAGISTESGIPDYRSESVGLYARSNHRPVQYQDFIKHPEVRQRYWARNFVGWPRFSSCIPNDNHAAIYRLQHECEKVARVVTQNVDSLHNKTGTSGVIELHGSAFRVNCLQCNRLVDRHRVQEQLAELNPEMREMTSMVRPDGDVEIPQEKVADFIAPHCESCGGDLKPDIVFFGDNVPKGRVLVVREAVTANDALLVLGSSLTVFSSYRIVLQAAEERKRICIVNIGPTRADDKATLRINAKCGDILPKLF